MRDCRIEVQIIIILGYLLDSLMVDLVQFMGVDGCDAVTHLIIFIQKQAPNAIQELTAAFDAAFAPCR
ncbi:hypothetical protein D3C74_494910 [compost metagenome]